jgi:hypothetical protein
LVIVTAHCVEGGIDQKGENAIGDSFEPGDPAAGGDRDSD